jgi:hypothetical protein
MRIKILQPSGLTKPQQLEMDEDILNNIYLLYVLNDVPTCFTYELTYKSICANRHADAYKAVRAKGVKGNLVTKLSQLWCVINETVVKSKISCWVMSLGRISVFEIFSSRPASSFSTRLSSANTCRASLSLPLI